MRNDATTCSPRSTERPVRGGIRRGFLGTAIVVGFLRLPSSFAVEPAEINLEHLQEYQISEVQLRSLVVHGPLPVIPPADRPLKREVVVAQVELDADGALRAITILEAPSVSAAKAMQRGLRSWQFAPWKSAGKARCYGKLTFYLLPAGATTHVVSPWEMQKPAKTKRSEETS
jgi:hypothetical protein